MYTRVLDLRRLLRHRSIFLFGARQTGKSTLLHHLFPEAVFFDLLEADTFRELSARPEYMRQTLPPGTKLVVIDEVQKLPSLLDEVHLMIERDKELRFGPEAPKGKESHWFPTDPKWRSFLLLRFIGPEPANITNSLVQR